MFLSLSTEIFYLSHFIENLSKAKLFIPINQHFIVNYQINALLSISYNQHFIIQFCINSFLRELKHEPVY